MDMLDPQVKTHRDVIREPEHLVRGHKRNGVRRKLNMVILRVVKIDDPQFTIVIVPKKLLSRSNLI